MTISLDFQLSCVDREIAMRVHVYPRLVASGKKRSGEAELELEHMRAVHATLKWLKANKADVEAWVAAGKPRAPAP